MTPVELLLSARLGADLVTALFLKGPILLGLAALAIRLFAGSASTRHAIWTAAILAVGILPLLEAFGPGWSATSAPLAYYPPETSWVGIEAVEAFTPGTPRAEGRAVLPVTSFLLLTWWIGVLALATRVVADLVRVRMLRRTCAPIERHTPIFDLLEKERRRLGIRRAVEVGLVPQMGLAATVGWGKPLIVLGPDVAALPTEALRTVLVHELAHVRRHDAATHVFTALTIIPAWPNPLVWWARRRLIEARERACDDRVLGQGIYASDYARVLLAFASPAALKPAVRSSVGLRFSSTKGRLDAILDPDVRRTPSSNGTRAIAATLLVGIALGLGTLDLLKSPPGTGSTEELIGALGHEDADVRTRAAQTLARRDASGARVPLERLLDDPSREVRLAAMSTLEQLADPASLDAMARVLERPFDGGRGESGFVLKLAMRTLGAIGTAEAAAVLDAQLTRPVAELRWLALEEWLGFAGSDPATFERLQWMARHDPSERNRRLALEHMEN